MKKMLHVNIA